MDTGSQAWLSLPVERRREMIGQLLSGQSHTDYIKLVGAGNLGVYASLGVHFDYAIFGRDSLQVAEDLLGTHRRLAEKIIITMARFQGVKIDPRSEEEPGKIHHEYRSRVFDGNPIPEVSLNIMKGLQHNWGDEASDELYYYGSYDATPQYIRLLGKYEKLYGPEFLDQTYHFRLGQRRLKDSLRAAVDWLVGKIVASSWQMYEYKRLNLNSGIGNQSWKDSGTSYLHSNGDMANYDGGIASIEMQGLAYDALKVGARLVAKSPAEQQMWLTLAIELRNQTIKQLWKEDWSYFAQGLDRGPDKQTRLIETFTSNSAAMLESDLISDLPLAEQPKYVDGIANLIASNEFMTNAGIRSRGLSHRQMPGFVDYHGSYTVWPKETFAIAKGLKRFGKQQLAHQLEANILSSLAKAGEFYEFFYVNDDGHVWYSRDEAINHFKSIGMGDNLAVPESGQAWTISAVLAILSQK